MMYDRETIVGELRTRARHGDSPATVATWLVRELGAADSRDFQIAAYMFHAFEISINAMKDAADWVGLGHGGTRTDDELNLLLGPLVPRSGDRELVQYPDGSWRTQGPDHEHNRWTATESERGYIRARLQLLTTEQGGRRAPLHSGYRAHWAFPPDMHAENHDAPLTLETVRTLAPGEEAMIRLHPLRPDLWPTITPGVRLSMLEGARLVGSADAVEVVTPAL
ncbi:hypothetical protein K7711_46615 [Nocardia sp. CA2R105]|uniref:hypothetical protein n=1 Tax=Nocardia coffeae TaxID=2873381 RepID=UPI001CA62A82|nr:hypothetical protein [Nocardia coffeae]MBY8864006.1 hypothetical protein [Nocardia coffeae]